MRRCKAVLAHHISIQLRKCDGGHKVVHQPRGRVARAAAHALLEVLFALHLVFEAHLNIHGQSMNRSRKITEHIVLEPTAGLDRPVRSDARDRARRKVVVAFRCLVEAAVGIGIPPEPARQIRKVRRRLVFWKRRVALVPGLAGLDGQLGVLASRRAAQFVPPFEEQGGGRLDDVRIKLSVPARRSLPLRETQRRLGAARPAEIGVEAGVDSTILDYVAVCGSIVSLIKQRNRRRGEEPKEAELGEPVERAFSKGL